MFFKVFNRQREPPKYILLYVSSLDFHLIPLPYAYTKPATPWRLTSINILLIYWAQALLGPGR